MEHTLKRLTLKSAIGTVILSLIAVIQIYPFIWMVLLSFKNNSEIFSGNILGLPKKLLWHNYEIAINSAKVGIYFLNSVKVTSLTIVISVFLALSVAYAIARLKWKYNYFVLNFFLLGLMIPAQAILYPIYYMAVKSSLNNTHFLLVMIYVVFALPTSIYIFTSFLKSLPKELEESAYIDGATVYRTFFSIIIPIIKSAIVTVVILNFLGAWNEFLFGFILIDKQLLRTIPVGIASMNGQYNTDWGPMGAGMVVATVPSVLIYALFSNQIQKGLIAGIVKG